jgi:hypothetical protein
LAYSHNKNINRTLARAANAGYVRCYIAKRIIYNDACKRYNFDLQFYKDAMMQKKLDKVRALKGNNVNENIANYKKRPW